MYEIKEVNVKKTEGQRLEGHPPVAQSAPGNFPLNMIPARRISMDYRMPQKFIINFYGTQAAFCLE
jgi:hypothetical protein